MSVVKINAAFPGNSIALLITTIKMTKLFYRETSSSHLSLLEVPGDGNTANVLGVSKLSENDRRDVDVASGTAGAAVGDRGQD